MIDQKIFGERVSDARKAMRLTQRALAEAIGVTENAVHQIEKGNNWPSLPSTLLMAETLKLSLDHLCGREEAHPRTKGGERVEEEIERLAQELARTQGALAFLVKVLADQGVLLDPPNLVDQLRVYRRQEAQRLGVLDDENETRPAWPWPSR